LTEDEQRAWRAYMRMVLLVDAAIARELNRDTGLSMPDYMVLMSLSETPGNRQRLTELAARMQWSASRLSHHVTRMQQRKLVERVECREDARVAYVQLTDDGWTALRAAAPMHVASVREHFVDVLTAEELDQLRRIGEKLAAHFGEDRVDVPREMPPGGDSEGASQTRSAEERTERGADPKSSGDSEGASQTLATSSASR
jgi:DNA-binding MarR family transcriptional regulator